MAESIENKDNVLILEPGDERAQKIGKAMASPTAGDILRLLGTGQKTLSSITEELALPLTTTKYHVDNLVEAGLIAVADTKYSVKGREVKVYSLTDRLLIVAPRPFDMRTFLVKYASLFVVVVLGTLGFTLILPALSSGSFATNAPTVMMNQESVGAAKANDLAAPMAAPFLPQGFDPVLAFLMGGLLVVFAMLVYEGYLLKKRKN